MDQKQNPTKRVSLTTQGGHQVD
jgi:inositol polyphosphate 5-phosphatase INPP5E